MKSREVIWQFSSIAFLACACATPPSLTAHPDRGVTTTDSGCSEQADPVPLEPQPFNVEVMNRALKTTIDPILNCLFDESGTKVQLSGAEPSDETRTGESVVVQDVSSVRCYFEGLEHTRDMGLRIEHEVLVEPNEGCDGGTIPAVTVTSLRILNNSIDPNAARYDVNCEWQRPDGEWVDYQAPRLDQHGRGGEAMIENFNGGLLDCRFGSNPDGIRYSFTTEQ